MKSVFRAGKHVSAVCPSQPSLCRKDSWTRDKEKRLTPIFISTDPHRSSIELFPSCWTCLICSIRMIEQATVKFPAANRMIKAILWRVSICNRMNSGIGMRKVIMSHAIVMDAVAWKLSALGSQVKMTHHLHSKSDNLPNICRRSMASSSSRRDGTGR